MHYFIEITCLPDEGVPVEFIMGKVMDGLHLAFVDWQHQLGYNPVGVSFPEYARSEQDGGEISLGNKIRLFSRDDQAPLQSPKLLQPLQRLADYVHKRSISCLERPNLKFATFQRVQAKSSRERLLRRQAKRSGQAEEDLRGKYHTFGEERLTLPFIQLRSHSNSQPFRLFVSKQAAQASEAWQFGSYGLSSMVAVPDF